MAVDLRLFRQQKFTYWNSNRRINIWDGPVRSGKTVNSIYRWIKYIGTAPPGDLLMTGKTNGSLYRNVIRPMQQLVGGDMNYHQEFDSRVIDMWGRKIYCFGANDERAEQKIRGGTFAGAYGDEITLWPESYWTMMLSRLSVRKSKFFGSTNPDNPNHYLKKNFINRANELDCNIFNWPIEANTFLDPEYIENLKKEYIGLWFRRYIKGEWCVAEGSIYDFFDEMLHTGKRMPKAKYYYVGIDYGVNNPTSFGLYGVNPHTTPTVWRERGYYWDSKKEGRQKTDAQYSKDLKTFLGDIKPRSIIIDPSASSLKLQIRKDHSFFVEDAKNEVIEGIQTQSKMLQTGQYMISQDKSNEPCINEYYGYVWDDNATKRGEDKPVKANDHTKDDERYVLHTKFGAKRLDYGILTRN